MTRRTPTDVHAGGYAFLIVFLMGELAGVTTADVSDWLFFNRVAEGAPLSPLEAVGYWYYVPAIFIVLMLAAALILDRINIVPAKFFAGMMLGVAVAGSIKSALDMGGDYLVLALIILPLIFLYTALFGLGWMGRVRKLSG